MNDKPVTVITGTRKGIGRFLAEHYLSRGHRVIGCSRSPADWKADFYEHHILDVVDERAVIGFFSHVRKTYGTVDHLINNAGVASMNHFVLTPLESVQKVLGTNFIGTFLCCREAAKLMMKSKKGRIVNFSTVAVPMKLEGEAVYASSKAAVEKLTQVLAKELADANITVNAVGPTPVETDLIRNVPEDKIRELLERQSLKRFGTFHDVANVIDFFLHPNSSFVTGQTVYLGGA